MGEAAIWPCQFALICQAAIPHSSKSVKSSSLAGAVSPTIPVLVCVFGIFLLSGMDAAMKVLVIAVGVYNTVLWRSMLATLIAGAGWLAGPRSLPRRVLRLHAARGGVSFVLLCFSGLAVPPLAEAIGSVSWHRCLHSCWPCCCSAKGFNARRSGLLAGIAGVVIIVAGQFGQKPMPGMPCSAPRRCSRRRFSMPTPHPCPATGAATAGRDHAVPNLGVVVTRPCRTLLAIALPTNLWSLAGVEALPPPAAPDELGLCACRSAISDPD